ncbi:MAG TPA: ECF-type sigma factor [Pirellulales bacterium]|jgi:RNA polymerase sigma-70 factor (ECF subfamily)|nr:ECF-type sigma factor [Pirellulales bacterium]
MQRNDEFSELFERVRGGDADAACVIVRRYESAIRVAVRSRLLDPALKSQLDSMDVCQSVLISFFIRAAAGAFDLHEPRQLVALLLKMAQNKLAVQVRNQHRQRRDIRRAGGWVGQLEGLASPAPGPIRHAAGKELLDRALGMMSPEIRGMAEQRMRGESWSMIASHFGGSADARRKQYERAVAQIADSLDASNLEG